MGLLDNTYISFVNLDHRTDRLDRMREVLERVNIQAVRTRGMLPNEYQGDPKRVEVMRKRTPGAIGCHFSQVMIMHEAWRKVKNAFVMEDDLIFCDDLHERIAILDKFLEGKEWDIVWLGGTFHVNPPHWHTKPPLKRDAELTEHPNIVRTYGAFSTHAYIVRWESIGKVLSMLDEQLDTSIGIDYAMIQMQPDLLTYAFVPGCVIQFDNQSDIGRGMTVYSNFKKLGPYWFQKNMNDFNPKTFNWAEVKC